MRKASGTRLVGIAALTIPTLATHHRTRDDSHIDGLTASLVERDLLSA